MKKIRILVIIILSFSISSYAGIKIKSDLSKQNLKGSVKSVMESKFKPIIKFGEVESWDKQGGSDIYLFNYDGNLIEENDYGSLGTLFDKTKYKYDVSGKLIEKNEYKSDGSLSLRFSYKYVDNENLILMDWYESDGSLVRKFIDKYDEKGNVIKISAFSPEGKLDAITTYKYDEKGLQIQENNRGYKITYNYDEAGNQTEENRFERESGKFINKLTNTYETFDKAGNWLKKTSFLDGVPIEKIEREIEYY